MKMNYIITYSYSPDLKRVRYIQYNAFFGKVKWSYFLKWFKPAKVEFSINLN